MSNLDFTVPLPIERKLGHSRFPNSVFQERIRDLSTEINKLKCLLQLNQLWSRLAPYDEEIRNCVMKISRMYDRLLDRNAADEYKTNNPNRAFDFAVTVEFPIAYGQEWCSRFLESNRDIYLQGSEFDSSVKLECANILRSMIGEEENRIEISSPGKTRRLKWGAYVLGIESLILTAIGYPGIIFATLVGSANMAISGLVGRFEKYDAPDNRENRRIKRHRSISKKYINFYECTIQQLLDKLEQGEFIKQK